MWPYTAESTVVLSQSRPHSVFVWLTGYTKLQKAFGWMSELCTSLGRNPHFVRWFLPNEVQGSDIHPKANFNCNSFSFGPATAVLLCRLYFSAGDLL